MLYADLVGKRSMASPHVVRALSTALGEIRIGHPAGEDVDMGALASHGQRDEVRSRIEDLATEAEVSPNVSVASNIPPPNRSRSTPGNRSRMPVATASSIPTGMVLGTAAMAI